MVTYEKCVYSGGLCAHGNKCSACYWRCLISSDIISSPNSNISASVAASEKQSSPMVRGSNLSKCFSYADVVKLGSRNNDKCSNISSRNSKFSFALWNAQSLRHKEELVKDYMIDKDLDAIFVTESWLKNHDLVEIGRLQSNGQFGYIHSPREGRPGGGVACLYRNSLKLSRTTSIRTKTFECLELLLETKTRKLNIITVYRSEPSKKNNYKMESFFREFSDLLASYYVKNEDFIVVGDFNFHVNKPDDPRTKQLLDILETFDLKQQVSQPTHRSGNILDLIITTKNSKESKFIVDELLSDHNCILFDSDFGLRQTQKQKIKYRKTKEINKVLFRQDIQSKLSFNRSHKTSIDYLDSLVKKYNSSIQVLDKHAPEITRIVTVRKPTPWTNVEIKKLKVEKRKAEKRWKKTRLVSDYDLYKGKRNRFNILLNDIKAKDLSSKIQANKNNSKAMFKVINTSLNRKQPSPLPAHDDDTALANEFIKFFDDKITTLKKKFTHSNTRYHDKCVFQGTKFTEFKPVTEPDIRKLINAMPNKHCRLDPLPTWLTKECTEEFLPITTEIINASLTIGTMPNELKHAIVKPLLKKIGLELIKKHYRPVSNLSFLGKLIEGVVIGQFAEHLRMNKLDDQKQSAYKKYHSTETLLTKVHNDVMLSMSKGEVVMLVLLDLSAAFDTVDHNILLNRLQTRYGIEGKALQWFRSYLTNRTQAVLIKDSLSDNVPLACGVPQGSKLGPVMFNAYISPLSEIAKKHDIEDEKYADDDQLYLAFKPSSSLTQRKAFRKMEKCIDEIRKFLEANKLCNNGEKTELLLIGNSKQLKELNVENIVVENTVINAVDHVKNLGVLFDKNMNMEKQINKMVKSTYANIKNIACIRNSLTLEDTKTAVNALVTPHLDYGNALLYGTSKKLQNKLQMAQNAAARLICKIGRSEHITPFRKQLHWLPIPARIQYKILTLVWKTLNNQAPSYLSNLVSKRQNHRMLRNNNRALLNLPNVINQTKESERSFSVAGPRLWNSLPESLRHITSYCTFKKSLKTHLFVKFYEPTNL